MPIQIQVFGMLFGSPLLTAVVMAVAGTVFAILARQVLGMLLSGVSLRQAMTTSFAFVICLFGMIYCFGELLLAVLLLCGIHG